MTSKLCAIAQTLGRFPRWLFFVDTGQHQAATDDTRKLNVLPSDDSITNTGKTRLGDGPNIEMDPNKPASSADARGEGPARHHGNGGCYVTRMLIWTLLVEAWVAWTPEAVNSVFIHLSFLVFVGVMVILKLYRFRLSSQCVRSGLVYTLTVLCAGCVLTLVAQPVFLRYEFLVKKVAVREYHQHLTRSPHVYVVASALAVMTCVARGLHKQR